MHSNLLVMLTLWSLHKGTTMLVMKAMDHTFITSKITYSKFTMICYLTIKSLQQRSAVLTIHVGCCNFPVKLPHLFCGSFVYCQFCEVCSDSVKMRRCHVCDFKKKSCVTHLVLKLNHKVCSLIYPGLKPRGGT